MRNLRVGNEVYCPGYGWLMIVGRTLKQGQPMLILSPNPAPIPLVKDRHGIINLVMVPEEHVGKVENANP